jgi:hypothetical protein
MFLSEFPATLLEAPDLGQRLMHSVMTDRAPDRETAAPPEPARLRLIRCRLEQRPGGRSRVSVAFEGASSASPIVCEQEGSTCPGGDLRLAARATLDALSLATQNALHFDLIGVKPTRAFDTNVMLVAVMVRQGDTATKVLGVAVDEDNTVLATVRATLHAVNRLVSPSLGPLPRPDPAAT